MRIIIGLNNFMKLLPTIYFCTRSLVNITHLPCVAWTTKFSDSCPLLDDNICFVSHLRVDNFDKYTLYVVLLGEPCRKHHIFCMFLHIWIFGSFENIVTRTFENIIWPQLQVHEKITMEKNMFLSLDIILMKWYNYVYWAHRHFILSCVSAKKCRASASEREWWCRSADEHQWTCVHRMWAPTNAAQRDWASCNRDKACGFRTNAATEPPLDQSWSHCYRRWAQLSVSWRTTAVIPSKWKQNRQILWRSSAVLKLAVSRRFSNKNRQCVIVAIGAILSVAWF